MRNFIPQIGTVNLWPQVGMHVGSPRHAMVIDEVEGITGPVDEERLLCYYQTGENYEDAARILGISADSVAAWYRTFKKRVNHCPRNGCCGTRKSR